jgi:hypothetical protein
MGRESPVFEDSRCPYEVISDHWKLGYAQVAIRAL